MNNKTKTSIFQIILVILLTLLCIIIVMPFMWTLSTSLRRPSESFKMPPSFLPTSFFIDNYISVFTRFPFLRFISNSLFVALIVIVLNIAVTTMSAYSFSRIDFKGRNVIFQVILSGMMIPASATMLPIFYIMSKMKLVGTLWPLILPAIISPLSIFLVRQFMMSIPKSYEEAAEIDGASRWTIFTKVILPMSKPVIIMSVIQTFLASWNSYMQPLIYLSKWETMTLPVGLAVIRGYMGAGNIGEILAGVIISLIVPVLLYIFGQRYLVEGIALTGVKS